MDNDGASDERNKESSIALTASSMINAADMINQDAYQANLRRIQEVKEMVRRLEMNNEAAHKNFLVDQLERRAKEGREAEIMLTQMRKQPGLSETAQFNNNVPSDKSEVILPTTATLVEVPESHSSSVMSLHSSPAPTVIFPPQTTRHGRPVEYQWNLPTQAQSYNPNLSPYYASSSTVHPRHSAAQRSQAPIEGQMRWYTSQNVPPQSGGHSPLAHQPSFQPPHVQQPALLWSSYPHPVTPMQAADTVPGNYASPQARARTAPVRGDPGTASSSTTYREPGFATQSPSSGLSVTTHSPSQNLSLAPSQVQVPLHGVTAPSVKVVPGQLPPTSSRPRRAEPQSQPIPVAVSKPMAISQFQPQKPPQPPQPRYQHQQSRSQPQQFPQPPPPRCPSQDFPSQGPIQPPQTHLHALSQSADRVPLAIVSQPHSQHPQIRDPLPVKASPEVSQTQTHHPTIIHEQAWRRGAQPRVDQATFIKLFQVAVQRGTLHLKTFFLQAKASGISDEWFAAAIGSLPRDVWESVVAQVNQSGSSDVPLPANVPQQVSITPDPNMSVVSARPPPGPPPVQTTSSTQVAVRPSTTAEGSITLSTPGQTSQSYAAQLQYYAAQATKSAFSAQAANIPTAPTGNIPSTQNMIATRTWDVPQVQFNVRTPKDANKSTLARDILRSLGKVVPNPGQDVAGKPMDKADDHEGDQLPAARPVVHMATPRSPAVPPVTGFVRVDSPPRCSAKLNMQAEPQHVSSPDLSTAKPVAEEEYGQASVIDGPIMIDLTLEDYESVDGKGQEPEPTFPIQTSANVATSSQPVSSANTTNQTPLLENLSLEEQPVFVAADGDNADIRMYSPPLPMSTEEDMESKPSYPPLGGAELLSPSFESLPREASEHSLDGRLPLFLPSPPVSPAHTEPPGTDLEMINDEVKPSLKRPSADVDEREIDTQLPRPPCARKRRRQQVYVLIPPMPPHVTKANKRTKERAQRKDIDSDLEGVGEDEEIQYSHLEQLLIEESKSRLLERRCRWLNCGAILNSAASLLAHLKRHACEEDSLAPFLCRWTSCQRQFAARQERDVHLERHVIRPLACPFAGCDEQFNRPVEVMQHEVQHQKAERREPLVHKPTCQPAVPAIPVRLGQPPHRLPSYRVIPRRVVKCQISADRHATMGPWILWNIFSQVELHTRKQNASMRGRPTRPAANYDMDSADPRHDDYDFLLAHSSCPAKNPELDDLDSTLITMSAARGLTLWGTGSATPEEDANAGRTRAEDGGAVVAGQLEEDAVERMLMVSM